MKRLEDIKAVYFVGVGGIGMSALARYFLHEGAAVAGYDRTETRLTRELEAEGAVIHYDESVESAPASAPVPPITFESCRSSTTQAAIRNLSVERLCDRPCFARIRCTVDVPIDILFVDNRGIEYIGKGVVSVDRDVLLSIPDESIVPYNLEAMASAICVSGCFVGNNQFKMTVCVTIVLKVLADVEILVPSYGYCTIPPAEEFADSVCEEFFSLPLFPTASACNTGSVSATNLGCTCNQNQRCGCNNPCGHGSNCHCR